MTTFPLLKTGVAVKEDKRTYYFPHGEKVVIENVCEVAVRDSGTHRLKSLDNGKTILHIIPPGWLHIEIDSPKGDWTV